MKNSQIIDFDKKFARVDAELGIKFKNGMFNFTFWRPLSPKVQLVIFDQNEKEIEAFDMQNKNELWTVAIDKKYDGLLYKYRITNDKNEVNLALDPYAKALANFDWKGKDNNVGFGLIIDLDSSKIKHEITKLETIWNNSTDPVIYELHIKDYTSLLNQNDFKSRLGTFNCALEKQIFQNLNDLNFTHLQLLPLHTAYTINANNVKIIKKGEANGWETNYNWGYDPHNYFSLNQSYVQKTNDPYEAILEFKKFVDEAHKNKIGIILDVVYNHTMTNKIYDEVLDGYYYRYNNERMVKPVNLAPVASERLMVRKMFVDSLVHWVKTYDVDGFRFDLSTFIDKDTLELICKTLREIKPNIVLHGEAWKFSDLNYKNSFTKGVTNNDQNFAYFNDTHRNAINGSDFNGHQYGLNSKYCSKKFKQYTISTFGNLKTYDNTFNKDPKIVKYDLYADDLGVVLNYVACHDGYTLWDKINIDVNGSIEEKIAAYKQSLMASVSCQGRQLMLAGTELLHSKPCDKTGEEWYKGAQAVGEQLFDDNADDNIFCNNTYKTSDFVNGLKWSHLDKPETQEVYKFTKELLGLRNNTNFFRLKNAEEVKKSFKFLNNSFSKNVSYKINTSDGVAYVQHNFGNVKSTLDFKLSKDDKLISSKPIIDLKYLPARSSIIMIKRGKNEN
ncbi:pullulanase (alpha-dextrin endo-1,6-alpha-glucosidase) [Mycoplasma crocodyli MP145]|uniref:Pullulanase (Alpha-dextrin endo-1,6-alpha-glucosidase) n=2 Tax=Mycoplasma TaxID=2093 RepID=D5E6C5_MYCCM|nr:pullulanase (alpha-dextrin endo-1,6-alpha-glucosidase) [Mycoplasma crocodyli MP145]